MTTELKYLAFTAMLTASLKVQKLLGNPGSGDGPMVSTFHSFAVRMTCMHRRLDPRRRRRGGDHALELVLELDFLGVATLQAAA